MFYKILIGAFICFFYSVFTTNAQDIIISGIPAGPFCGGDTFRVSYNYQVPQSLGSSNRFTAVLSNSGGQFTSGVYNVGNSGTTQSTKGSLLVTIPYNLTKSNRYRIRVTSSSPAFQSIPVDSFTINDNPLANFLSGNSTQCFKHHNFVFTNTSTGIGPLNYSWTFGDGDTSSAKNPTKKYPGYSTYIVKLVVSGSNFVCKGYTLSSVSVLPSPVAKFTINDSTQCLAGNNFALTNASPAMPTGTLYPSWLVGTFTSTQDKPNFIFASAGSFTARLIVTASSNSCRDTAIMPITVYPTPAKPTITGPTACIGQQTANYNVSGSSINNYNWAVSGGTIESGQGSQQISVKWFENNGITGRVSVIEVSPYGCSSTAFMLPVNLSSSAVRETKNPFGISVYPNPATDWLTINTRDYSGKYKLTMYNNMGQIVLTNNYLAGEQQLDISKLNTGLYLYTIEGDNFTYSEKLIKYGN